MAGRLFTFTLAVAGLFVQTKAQCPNTVAADNPNLRTMSANYTRFILPVPKVKVIKALNEAFILNPLLGTLELLQLPSNLGFPEGSKTPLNAPLNGYIGGEYRTTLDKLRFAGVVPAAVSLLVDGYFLRLGDFLPANAAYQSNNNGLFSANSKWTIAANPLTGPGAYVEAADAAFITTPQPRYPLEILDGIVNQPMVLNGAMTGMCQQNSYFFNETTAQAQLRSGNVTLGPAASGYGVTSGTLQGKYIDVHGFSACAQLAAFMVQKCEDLAKGS